jgi:hypothetical protein
LGLGPYQGLELLFAYIIYYYYICIKKKITNNKDAMEYKVSAFKVIINRVSSQITMVIVNKMRIVLTLVNSNLGLYITYLQN